MVKVVLAIVVLVLACSQAVSQDTQLLSRLADMHEHLAVQQPERPANYFQSREQSELRLLFASIVRTYQLLISSQDADMCAYEPSCSRFGLLSMNRFGVIKGFLLTADRLTRCSGLTDSRRDVNAETGKFIDPIERYAPFVHAPR
jgi:putative component of membrane protein insertase Oxa1/YidC/SpoIIIJ protein YidD